ncbi:unnamed protein product [Closterium sp. NIES-53]
MASVASLPAALTVAAGVSASLPASSLSHTPSPSSSNRIASLKCRAEARKDDVIFQPPDVAKWLGTAAVTLSATAALFCSSVDPAFADVELKTYYGTAASASSYGGYGGNASKQATAEYIYGVPDDWKERAISKVEKGTNGTDSEFFWPKNRNVKTYVTFLAGFRRLPPQDNVLSDIALSDVNLQDLILSADEIKQGQHRDAESNQLYYDFEIDSPLGHALITVTAAKNKLYAHFVNAPDKYWKTDEALLRQIQTSFKTVGRDPLAPPDVF